ncbi:MAG TPA: pilin [Candidatus Udaeobacter sp.]|nr:pilin [Candidatus Udaeobacter sp.]
MKIFRGKYILFILSGILFFSAQADKARADEFGCQGNMGCKNVTAGSFESAAFVCQNSCASLNIGGNCLRLAVPCPPEKEFGCIKNEECKTISADSVETANRICANYCGDNFDFCSSISSSCPPPLRQWGCVQADGCQNIESMYYSAAKKSCQGNITSDPCPAGSGVSGTSARDLKNQARSILNKANFSGPTDIINRTIKILLAFIGSIALVLYIYSGFLWMTASGGSEQVEKAKITMVWTTLGVVMMLASYVLASFIFSSLGV